jgi:hypothetical protein
MVQRLGPLLEVDRLMSDFGRSVRVREWRIWARSRRYVADCGPSAFKRLSGKADVKGGWALLTENSWLILPRHSITSSARVRSRGGMSRPIALAVLS